jgi:peptidoglycan pentaglycine glycine transferase (the first glycine)
VTSQNLQLQTITPSAEAWDAFVERQPRAHPLQLSAWGAFKSQYGWRCERVALQAGNEIMAGAQVLLRRLPARLGALAYIPMGPYAQDESSEFYSQLWTALRQRLTREHRAALLKIEPGLYFDSTAPDWSQWGFVPSPQTVQPPRTIVLDITGTQESALARMNQGTRRKIRQSVERNGIIYSEAQTAADVAKFTQLMQVTGSRNEFGVHEPAYYQRVFEQFVPQHRALILAEHEGDVLAGVMVFAAGKNAVYLYGASSDTKRNLMASDGVQWQAIRWAQAHGCHWYDLWGIPDAEEAELEADFQTRSDGLWGVYGFKRGWGGKIVRSIGTWDQVYNPLVYRAYQFALKRRGHSQTDAS